MSDVIRSRRKALGMATWRTASGFLDQEDPAVLKLRFLSPRLLRSFEAWCRTCSNAGFIGIDGTAALSCHRLGIGGPCRPCASRGHSATVIIRVVKESS